MQLPPHAKLWSLYPWTPAEELPKKHPAAQLFSRASISYPIPTLKPSLPSIKQEGEVADAAGTGTSIRDIVC